MARVVTQGLLDGLRTTFSAAFMQGMADIRDGRIKIDEGNVDAIAARPDAVLISDAGRIFSRDSMQGF